MGATQASGIRQSPATWADRTAGRWFFTAAASASLLISIASFGPAIVHPEHRPGTFDWLSVVHGLLYFLWLLIFVVQTLLVQVRKVSLHRTLGTASMFLAAAMVVTGYIAVVAMTRRGFDFSGDLALSTDPLGPVSQMIFPLSEAFEFGILVLAGYIWRRNPAAHKRLMLFATIAILPGAFAHFVGYYYPLHAHPWLLNTPVLLVLTVPALYDFIQFRRIHPVSLWVGAGLFTANAAINNWIGASNWWHRLAEWMIR
jgi:hypothetical protein